VKRGIGRYLSIIQAFVFYRIGCEKKGEIGDARTRKNILFMGSRCHSSSVEGGLCIEMSIILIYASNEYDQAKRTFSPGRPSERRTTAYKPVKIIDSLTAGLAIILTYFPLIFQPGSSLSSLSAISSPWSPRPTTTSLLIVLKLAITGAPEELAMGPIAASNGVLAGAAQS